MYESFYGFKEPPFTLLPDPSFLYLGKQHSVASTMLQYGALHPIGTLVLTGEIGSGKTTLIQHLLNQLKEDTKVGLITNTHPKFGDLLQWVSLAFRLGYEKKSKTALYHQFVDFLTDCHAEGQRSILIIDEAQNLSLDALEEIRLLSNLNTDKPLALQLILVGQSELCDKLRRPESYQFTQRVAITYHLKPLVREETEAYIQHRLNKAGGDPALFDPRAIEVIHQQSGGIPRLINIICDTALIYGYVDHKKHIGVDIIYAVVQDKADNALLRIDNKEQAAAEESITSSVMPSLSKLIPSSLAASAELKDKIALF
jgi:general secretion pathway protein A